MYPIEVADMMVFRQHLNPHKTKRIAQKILKNQAELKDLPSEFRFLYDFCIIILMICKSTVKTVL